MVVAETTPVVLTETSEDKWISKFADTDRGDKGFGSTGQ